MTKVQLLTIAVIGLLVLNLGMLLFLLFRKPGAERMPLPGEGPRRIIIERLHFDAAQVQRYETLITAHRSAIGKLEKDMNETRSALYRNLRANGGRQDSLMKELGAWQQAIEATHYAHFTAIRDLCRPDQLPYFDALTGELAALFRPGRPPGPPAP